MKVARRQVQKSAILEVIRETRAHLAAGPASDLTPHALQRVEEDLGLIESAQGETWEEMVDRADRASTLLTYAGVGLGTAVAVTCVAVVLGAPARLLPLGVLAAGLGYVGVSGYAVWGIQKPHVMATLNDWQPRIERRLEAEERLDRAAQDTRDMAEAARGDAEPPRVVVDEEHVRIGNVTLRRRRPRWEARREKDPR